MASPEPNKMLKLRCYECENGYQMYATYNYDNDKNVSIIINCECGFRYLTEFGQVVRVTKYTERQAIENFYEKHPKVIRCSSK